MLSQAEIDQTRETLRRQVSVSFDRARSGCHDPKCTTCVPGNALDALVAFERAEAAYMEATDWRNDNHAPWVQRESQLETIVREVIDAAT